MHRLESRVVKLEPHSFGDEGVSPALRKAAGADETDSSWRKRARPAKSASLEYPSCRFGCPVLWLCGSEGLQVESARTAPVVVRSPGWCSPLPITKYYLLAALPKPQERECCQSRRSQRRSGRLSPERRKDMWHLKTYQGAARRRNISPAEHCKRETRSVLVSHTAWSRQPGSN